MTKICFMIHKGGFMAFYEGVGKSPVALLFMSLTSDEHIF